MTSLTVDFNEKPENFIKSIVQTKKIKYLLQ